MKSLTSALRSRFCVIPAAVFAFWLAVYTLAGFFLVPFLVRHYLPQIAEEALGKRAAVGEVRLNPFALTFEAQGFRLQEPDGGAIAAFERLFVDLEWRSVLDRAWTFRRVGLEGAHVNAVIGKDGVLNLARLAPAAPAAAAPPADKGGEQAPPPLVVAELAIEGGRLDFTDRRPAQPAAVTLHPITLSVQNLSTLPRQEGAKSIVMTSAEGETIRWSGRIGLNPLLSHGTVTVEGLKTATLWKFFQDALELAAPEGRVNLKADYAVDLSGDTPQARLANLAFALTGAALTLQGEPTPFLELPAVRLEAGRVDLQERRVEIAKAAVSGGRLRAAVGADGRMNLERILRETAPAAAAPPDPGGKPWKIDLAAFELGDFGIAYEDRRRTPGAEAAIGRVALAFKAAVEAGGAESRARVEAIGLQAADIRAALEGAPEPPVRIDALAVEGGVYDRSENAFTAERVSVAGGAVDLRREGAGTVNLARFAAPPEGGETAREAGDTGAPGRPFRFLARSVAVSGLKASITDRGIRPEGTLVNLEQIAVTLSDVDGKSPMPFEAGLAVAEGGRVRAAGRIDPAGPAIEAEVALEELTLPPFQPLADPILAATIASGAFSTRGRLTHGAAGGGARTTYRGGFRVDNLEIKPPGGGRETLVGWKTLATDQLALDLEPNRLEIGDLRLSQPTGKFVIEKDQTINLARLAKTGNQGPPPGKPAAAEPFPYRVKRILVSGGRVDFADLSLPTPFGTRIHELKGVVAGIASSRGARAQVKLDGRVDEYGTAKVEGEINTGEPKAFTDIGVVFRNVEMSRLTPYSGKFAGRKIDAGKLSVDLKYKIDQGRLKGDNQIVVERLKLGERVESPEALDLPLDLAVALLEDSNGVIDLGLPVSGNLDSPEFSFGALVGKAIVNLLTKIVTSPFRAIGALLGLGGGGDEALDAVAFEPGSPALPPPEQEKLVRLAAALTKRPQLRIAVEGRYAAETDRAELRLSRLRRAVAERLGQSPPPGEEPGPVDFSSPEAGKALAAMFAERFGPETLKAITAEHQAEREKTRGAAAKKGRTAAVDQAAAEDPGELAKRLFERLAAVEPVEEGALARLAEERARAVAGILGTAGGVAAERISLLPAAAAEGNTPPSAGLKLEAGR